MKHKISGKVWAVLAAGMFVLLTIGCGGGAKKIGLNETNPFPSYSGPTGSIILHVVWPSREIPPETTVIDIEVTGEGLQTSRKAQIQRPQNSARIDNLPIGQKGVSATARAQVGGPALAYGFATTIVEPNKTKDVVIELKRVEQAGVSQARALIQEVRDSVVSFGGSLATQVADQSLVWTADLIPTFALTLQRLDFVRLILTEAHPVRPDGGLDGELPESGTLTSLPPATYQAHLFIYEWGLWHIGLERIGDPPAPNTWVVKFPQGDALLSGMELSFTLSKKDNNLKANEGEFRVTSATEPQLLYEGRCTVEADAQNRVTKLTVNGTFKDKFLPDGITVQGTVTGTPQENAQKSYTRVSFTGSIQSPKLSLSVGEAIATFASPEPDHEKWGYFLTKAELKNFKFKTQNVAEPVEVTGTLSVETVLDDETAEKGPLPKKGNFTGTFQSSKLAYEGSISFDWQNPQRPEQQQEVPKGTASFNGRWAVPNRPVFSVSLTMTSSNPPDFEIAIDITRGDHFLRGKLTGKWELFDNDNLKVTQWVINLKNENDLLVRIGGSSSENIFGSIFAPDETTKLADIEKDPDLEIVVVRYIDGTLEALFPTSTEFSPKPILGTVQGRVTDAQTGEGIPWVWVWSGYEGTSTDEQGFYELKALAGQQKIEFQHWRYEPKREEVNVPPHGTVRLDVQLQPTGQPE